MKKNKVPNFILTFGIVALALGCVSIFLPGFTLEVLIRIIGVIISAAALFILLYKFSNKIELNFNNVLFILGVLLNIAFGVFLALRPDIVLDIFIIILGAIIIICGLLQVFIIVKFRPLSKTAIAFLVEAIIMTIVGAVFTLKPFETGKAIAVFYGICVSLLGLAFIVLSFWLRSIMKNKPQIKSTIIDITPETPETPETPQTHETQVTDEVL